MTAAKLKASERASEKVVKAKSRKNKAVEKKTITDAEEEFPIVGIGASAGSEHSFTSQLTLLIC